MRILVVGGGGREHALVWKIAQSPLVTKIYAAPGNPGIARHAENVPLRPTDLDALADFAERERIDLTVVGPEAPLTAGIVDRFEGRGLRIFGPSADPARLEGSKVFAKKLMQTAGIPTAAFWDCDSLEAAQARVAAYYAEHGPDTRIVLKADGLAAGKGVVVAANKAEADAALVQMMGDRIFGAAGDRVIIEECLEGEEASIMAITDGETVVPLVPSQDHKRVFDHDQGPNTGGMGAYTPVPAVTDEILQQTLDRILKPAVAAIGELGIPYRGVLYAGIMITKDGPKTIEFNCRFGDPETQVVLPMLASDLVPLLLAVTDCTLESVPVVWRQGAAASVVAASGGYPGDYITGYEITGLETVQNWPDCFVFHAGTRAEDGKILTDGGRVLAVTGVGETLPLALERAYSGLHLLHFDGIHYRKDIAHHAL